MANRVGSYFPKGGHSATQTELKVWWTNIRWNITKTLTQKAGNREPHQNTAFESSVMNYMETNYIETNTTYVFMEINYEMSKHLHNWFTAKSWKKP